MKKNDKLISMNDEDKKLQQNAAKLDSPIDLTLRDIESGVNLTHSLKRNNITSGIFFRALEKDETKRLIYNAAIEAQTHELADQLLEIPDTYDDVARAKLKSENIKWLISKRNRKSYGDKLEIDHNHNIDIKAALNSATSRLKEVNNNDQSNLALDDITKSSNKDQD